MNCNIHYPRIIIALLISFLILNFAFPVFDLVHAAPDATFTVDSDSDADDANPGDGNCDIGNGDCTLRAAISEANALAGADTITLYGGNYYLTLTGHSEDDNATGDLDIKSDITINGAGAGSTTIYADENDRAIEVFSGATVELNNLKISGGKTHSFSDNCKHGQGGGIHNTGTLTIRNSIITGNSVIGVPEAPAGCSGGGIASNGDLTIEDSTISENAAGRASNSNYDSAGDGGGIYSLGGTVTIKNTDIIANETGSDATYGFNGDGGGIYIKSGILIIENSTISSNEAVDGVGGGVAIINGTVTIENSTISGNDSYFHGGGVYLGGGSMIIENSTIHSNASWPYNGAGVSVDNGTVTIENSTISGNEAGRAGGGVNVDGGSVTLAHTTITDNQTSDTTGSYNGGGGISNSGGTLEIKNSIIFGNDDMARNERDDCAGTITSLGYNLVGTATGCPDSLGDIITADARLGPLRNNGGDTLTHALQSNSPAVNAIPSGESGCGTTYTTDQCGETRPQVNLCDIGSYELGPPEMDIQGNGQSITDGDNTPDTADHTDFGEADVNTEAITYTFTISNTGVANLVLNGTPRVEIGGVGADAFSLTAAPDTPVSIGGTSTFQIAFDPTDTGLRTAVVIVTNDDPDENPYVFAIQGTGTGTPDAVILKSLAARSPGRVLSGILVALVWGVSAGIVGWGGWRGLKRRKNPE